MSSAAGDSLLAALGPTLLDAHGASHDTAAALDAKLVGVYFTAGEPEAAAAITAALAPIYTALVARGRPLEIVWVPAPPGNDGAQPDATALAAMPWKSVPPSRVAALDVYRTQSLLLPLGAAAVLMLFDTDGKRVRPSAVRYAARGMFLRHEHDGFLVLEAGGPALPLHMVSLMAAAWEMSNPEEFGAVCFFLLSSCDCSAFYFGVDSIFWEGMVPCPDASHAR